MATRKYKKISRKIKKMNGSGNTIISSKKKDSNKNKKNSQDDLDILESGKKSEHLLDLLERGALSDVLKMIQTHSPLIEPKKNLNSKTFKGFMNNIQDGNRKGPVKFGGSGKLHSKSSRKKSPYKDQKKNIEDIKNILTNNIKKMNITKNSSSQELEIADDTIRSLNDVNKLKEINNLLKQLNHNIGGKRVRKTRKYKR
jgi:hypothetical protein